MGGIVRKAFLGWGISFKAAIGEAAQPEKPASAEEYFWSKCKGLGRSESHGDRAQEAEAGIGECWDWSWAKPARSHSQWGSVKGKGKFPVGLRWLPSQALRSQDSRMVAH